MCSCNGREINLPQPTQQRVLVTTAIIKTGSYVRTKPDAALIVLRAILLDTTVKITIDLSDVSRKAWDGWH